MQTKQELKTGDLILFNTHSQNVFFSCIDTAIRWWSSTPFTHCGFVVVDPPWGAPAGTYIWDSSYHDYPDPADKKIKFGVALVAYDDYQRSRSELYVRKPVDEKTYELFTPKLLQEIHDMVYGKPYDTSVQDWVMGALKISHKMTNKSFVCSSLLQYILTKAQVLEPSTLMPTPGDFEKQNDNKLCKWKKKYKKEIRIS